MNCSPTQSLQNIALGLQPLRPQADRQWGDPQGHSALRARLGGRCCYVWYPQCETGKPTPYQFWTDSSNAYWKFLFGDQAWTVRCGNWTARASGYLSYSVYKRLVLISRSSTRYLKRSAGENEHCYMCLRTFIAVSLLKYSERFKVFRCIIKYSRSQGSWSVLFLKCLKHSKAAIKSIPECSKTYCRAF